MSRIQQFHHHSRLCSFTKHSEWAERTTFKRYTAAVILKVCKLMPTFELTSLGHLGTDGRFYLLDFARVAPPEPPQARWACLESSPVNWSSQTEAVIYTDCWEWNLFVRMWSRYLLIHFLGKWLIRVIGVDVSVRMGIHDYNEHAQDIIDAHRVLLTQGETSFMMLLHFLIECSDSSFS